MQPLLEAEVVNRPDPQTDVREEVEALRSEVAALRAEWERDRRQVAALFQSARIVFGSGGSAASGPTTSDSDKWERLKAKLGGKMAEIIEALQLTGTATRTQLKKQTGGALGTVDQAVYKLRDMGLLIKNGDGWSLKP